MMMCNLDSTDTEDIDSNNNEYEDADIDTYECRSKNCDFYSSEPSEGGNENDQCAVGILSYSSPNSETETINPENSPELIYHSPEKDEIKLVPSTSLDVVPVPSFCELNVQPNFGELLKTVPFSSIPRHYGILRVVSENSIDATASNGDTGQQVIYKAENGKTLLKSMDEVHAFLSQRGIPLPICCFTFDTSIRPHYVYFKDYWKEMTFKEDLSDGQEHIPIKVICADSTNSRANLAAYVKESFPAKDVKLTPNHDDGFLVCCDCIDDCKDKLNCPCFQKTLDNCSNNTRKLLGDANIGYNFQRLYNTTLSGIFECNRLCKCSKTTCLNRVTQNEIICMLQLFMTQFKGWGVRLLHDIPKGKIVTSKYANKISENWDEKWKYLSELHVGEVPKEGYEAEVVDPNSELQELEKGLENLGRSKVIVNKVDDTPATVAENQKELTSEEWKNFMEDTSSMNDQHAVTSCFVAPSTHLGIGNNNLNTNITHEDSRPSNKEITDVVSGRSDRILRSSDIIFSARPENYKLLPTGRSGVIKTSFQEMKTLWRLNVQSEKLSQVHLSNSGMVAAGSRVTEHMYLDDWNLLNDDKQYYEDLRNMKEAKELENEKLQEELERSSRLSCQFLIDNVLKSSSWKSKKEDKHFHHQLDAPIPSCGRSRNTVIVPSYVSGKTKTRSALPSKTTRRRRKTAVRRAAMCALKRLLTKALKTVQTGRGCGKVLKRKSIRPRRKKVSYAFTKRKSQHGGDSKFQHPLLKFDLSVDGSEFGNIGRYLNHSCDPNIFPQYVFTDCHDLRLPKIAFFAARNIYAGEELTWDYKYQVDDGSDNAVEDRSGQLETSSKSAPEKIKNTSNKTNDGLNNDENSMAVENKNTSKSTKRTRIRLSCRCGQDNCTKKIC